MARPPTPPPVWNDIDLARWEAEPDWMAKCRTAGQSEGFKLMHTVLVNERPSRQGERDASFVLGYEHCLAQLEFLAKGHARPKPEQQNDVDYIQPSTVETLKWNLP